MSGRGLAAAMFGSYIAVAGPGWLLFELWPTNGGLIILVLSTAAGWVLMIKAKRRWLRRLAAYEARLSEGAVPDIVLGNSRYERYHPEWGDSLHIWNLDGFFFTEFEPKWWHVHWPQTVGVSGGVETWRCGCRKFSGPSLPWTKD